MSDTGEDNETDAIMFGGVKGEPFFKSKEEERKFNRDFAAGVTAKLKARDEANREYAIKRKRDDLIKLLGPDYIKESILELLKSDPEFVNELKMYIK